MFQLGFLSDLTGWAKDVVESAGYIGVFLMIVLENVFPPIPSEAILPLAGFLAGEGRFWLPAVILAATLGAVAGALILYYLAFAFGDQRVRWLINRYGKWFAVSEADLDKANDWFDRHGSMAVFLCRMVPIVRSLVSLPAGLRRMNLTTFIFYTALGAGIWNSLLIIAGWWLGDNWEEVSTVVDYLEYPIYLAILGAIALFIWKKKLSPAARSGGNARNQSSTPSR
jgi:membrane protein DedA with SNARE-associated domain